MTNDILAKRYAESFWQHLPDAVIRQKAVEELEEVKKIIGKNASLRRVFAHPEITNAQKFDLVDAGFRQISVAVKQFLKLLVEKKHFTGLIPIIDYVKILYLQSHNIQPVVIRTARPLEENFLQAIQKKLEKRLQRKLTCDVQLAPELIGGLQVTIGHTVIDASVKKRLADLREKLMAIKVN